VGHDRGRLTGPDGAVRRIGPADLLRLFDFVLKAFACVLLAALVSCVMAGVISRGWGEPFIWTDEGARFLMAWLAATGWMVAARGRAHVRIRFFQNLLPGRLWSAAELVVHVASTLFGAATAVFGAALVHRNYYLAATSLPISMSWLYIPLVPAGTVIALQSGHDAIFRLRRPAATPMDGKPLP
jgi:TRAP-type C4-dicarboxylate transport system permease small subunit